MNTPLLVLYDPHGGITDSGERAPLWSSDCRPAPTLKALCGELLMAGWPLHIMLKLLPFPLPQERTATNMTITVPSQGAYTSDVLTTDLAAFVTSTSSTANGVIDFASAELSKRIARQIEEIEKESVATGSTPPKT